MTPRERLHRLVDVLPEAMLADVERMLLAFVLASRVPADVRATLAAEPGASNTGARVIAGLEEALAYERGTLDAPTTRRPRT